MNIEWILIGVLMVACVLCIAMSHRWPVAAGISMAVGAALVLVMIVARCDAVTIETTAVLLALAALWRRPAARS